jgi:preprotein translocase subunit SecD
VTGAPCGNRSFGRHVAPSLGNQEVAMNAIIYLVGLVVIVMFILSVVGLR